MKLCYCLGLPLEIRMPVSFRQLEPTAEAAQLRVATTLALTLGRRPWELADLARERMAFSPFPHRRDRWRHWGSQCYIVVLDDTRRKWERTHPRLGTHQILTMLLDGRVREKMWKLSFPAPNSAQFARPTHAAKPGIDP